MTYVACMLSGFSSAQLLRPHGLWPTRLPVHGVLQARMLERVAMPSSRRSSLPRDRIHVPYVFCIGPILPTLYRETLYNLHYKFILKIKEDNVYVTSSALPSALWGKGKVKSCYYHHPQHILNCIHNSRKTKYWHEGNFYTINHSYRYIHK